MTRVVVFSVGVTETVAHVSICSVSFFFRVFSDSSTFVSAVLWNSFRVTLSDLTKFSCREEVRIFFSDQHRNSESQSRRLFDCVFPDVHYIRANTRT